MKIPKFRDNFIQKNWGAPILRNTSHFYFRLLLLSPTDVYTFPGYRLRPEHCFPHSDVDLCLYLHNDYVYVIIGYFNYELKI